MFDDALTTSLIQSLIPLVIGIFILSILPFILRWKRLEEVRPELPQLFKKYGMTPPRIYVVQSDYINAFAVILAFPPYTLFTSHLTNLFNSKEVFAVLLHETGHHSNKNSISFLVTISLLIFYLMLIPILILLLVISIAVKQYITLLWTLAVLLLSRIIFAWLITTLLRKGEKDADLYASKTLGKNRIWLINSLRKLEIAQKKKLKKISLLRLARRLLCLVYFDPFQTHPPIPERIKYIKDCP